MFRCARMPPTRLGVIVLAVALYLPDAGWAQSMAPSADTADVVVIGSGLSLPPGTPAYGSTTIRRDRLVNDASGRVEDVLTDVAGFQQFRRSDSRSANPSAQGATLRGLGGNATSRTLVLLDGVPIADPFFGSIPFNALVPDRLAGIRVTRGGGSGPFGSGAVAGTIELVSADRRDLPEIAGEASYGSRNAQEVRGALSPTLGDGFATLSGRFERGDGFQTTPADQRVAASVPARYRDWSSALRAVVATGADSELQVHGLLFGDNRTLRFAGADSSSSGEDASVRYIARGRWQVDALGYLQARNFTNKVVSATSFRLTLDQRNTPSTGLGGKIELRPPVGVHHGLRIGGDDRLATGDLYEDAYSAAGSLTTQRNAGGDINDVGLFAEDDWTIGRLVLTGGARFDRWTITDGFLRERSATGLLTADNQFADRQGNETTGRGGVLYHAARWADLRAAAYTSYRLPTLNELYRPFVVFPITTQANATLDPERLRGVEGGIDLHPRPQADIGLTLFYNRLNDAIANVTIAPNLRRRENVAAIVAKGVELTAAWHYRTLALSGSYALSDSSVAAPGTTLDGLRPAQTPKHAASATIAWQPLSGGLASITARYVGDQFEDDLQTNILPAAWTVDAVAKLPIGRHVAVVVRAENLLDATVETRNQGGSIDLGTPRTFWISLRLN